MVQKNMPYINKSGYSMFWNSMWDDNINYSKNLQKDFFLKSFINFFFSDFIYNQFINNYKKNNFNVNNFLVNHNFNILNKNIKFIKSYMNLFCESYFVLSKIWLFKYQNWVVLYFYVFSKNNTFFKKNSKIIRYKKSYLYNYLNNYYLNIFKFNKINYNINNKTFKKNNF